MLRMQAVSSLKKTQVLFHIFVITGFSLTFIYSLLAPYPQFFVAHDSGPIDVCLLMAVVSAAIPLALTGVAAVSLLPFRRLGVRHVAVPLVASFMLLSLFLVKHFGLPSAGWAWTAASVSAVTLTLLYLRVPVFRTSLSLMSLALIVMPVSFALNKGVRRFFVPPARVEPPRSELSPQVPVVWLVFDELPLSSLLDHSMEMDAALFPNFARFAARSYWFRGAASAYMDTERSLAAAMSGRFMDSVDQRAWLRQLPENVFTILGPGRAVVAHESGTALCPPEMRHALRAPLGFRLQRLFSDLAVVVGHLFVPDATEFGVPEIADRWADFRLGGPQAEKRGAPRGRANDLFQYIEYMGFGRIEVFERSLEEIPSRPSRLLYFHHMIFPHVPYQFFPDGRYYSYGNAQIKGLRSEVWGPSEYLAELGLQRHLFQVGYADHLLGDLLDRLAAVNMLDPALVVVMADHGAAFRSGHHRRGSRDAIEDIAPIPLLIKLPGQTVGVVSDEPVQTTDIMPTVLRILGADAAPGMDGHAVLDAHGLIGGGSRSPVIYTPSLERVDLPGDLPARLRRAVARKEGIFGQCASWNELRIRPSHHAEMLGRPRDEFRVSNHRRARVHWVHPAASSSDPNWIPALVGGRVSGAADGHLAIFVDGVAQAIVPLLEREGTHLFSALLPAGAFVHRDPNITFFLPRQEGGELLLERAADGELGGNGQEYTLDLDHPDGARIRLSGGPDLPIVPGALRGFVDNLAQKDEHTNVSGWAAEPAARRPPTRILLFIDGHLLLSTTPWVQRLDAARAVFGSDHPAELGFAADLPAREFPGGLRGELRAFALGGRGAASELGNAIGSPCEPSSTHALLWPSNDLVRHGGTASLVYRDGSSTLLDVPAGSFVVRAAQQRSECVDLVLKVPPEWIGLPSVAVLLYQDGHFLKARELKELLVSQHAMTRTDGVALTVAEKNLWSSAGHAFSVVLLAKDGRGALIPEASTAN
jgi:hypothetical protein